MFKTYLSSLAIGYHSYSHIFQLRCHKSLNLDWCNCLDILFLKNSFPKVRMYFWPKMHYLILPEQSNPWYLLSQLQSPVFKSHLPFSLHSFGHFNSGKNIVSCLIIKSQVMSQSIYGKFQGRDNSCTSGEAASAGIENSPRVTKGLSQFPKNGLAGVVK